MQDSNDPSLTKSGATEIRCDPTETCHSENQNCAPQDVRPSNFVEISQILKPDSAGDKQEAVECSPEDEDQDTLEDEPLPSAITLAAMLEAYDRRASSEAAELWQKYNRECDAQEEAERLAQEEGADQEDEEEFDEEEFAQEKPSEPEPDYQFRVRIGGTPANMAQLTAMEDLIRPLSDSIQACYFIAAEDGVINQFCKSFKLPWDLRLYQPLYDCLILPTGVKGFGTTGDLFHDISNFLSKHVLLPPKECALLTYWAISTWFTDYLSSCPGVFISGPISTADLLLRTLVAVCRRPVLLGELSPAILRKLPITELTPTLLIREPQLNRYMSALLNASNQPGYLFFSGRTFQQLYCPKCIYVGECFNDAPAMSNSVHINLTGTALTLGHCAPTNEEIASFQNRLFSYRLLNHDKVAAANFRVSGFRPEISAVVDVLAAAIVDDVELQREVIAILKDRDEQSRVDRATGVNGVVLQAVLFHCHQKDQLKLFVREIAATANRLYAEDGESLKLSSETVGHVLKRLGLYTRRLGNAGRGLMLDKATQSQAHSLGHAYDALAVEPTCEYCHQFQQPQTEEVVQDV
jgi:hypothetical protein